MEVTPKAYRIWRRLFEEPNRWITLNEIAFDVDMTCRQVSSVIQTMNSDNIIRAGDPRAKPAVMLKCTKEEYDALKREVTLSFNHLDDEVFWNIRRSLSNVGWTSAQDVALLTGYGGAKISIAVSFMDDVKSKDAGKSKLYMLGK